MNSKITVIGAGKLAKSFVLGLLKKGYSPEFITVVYRTNHDVFKGIKVNFVKIVPEDTNLCIFMVRPQDVGDIVLMIKDRNTFFNSIKNVFFISGITPTIIKRCMNLKKDSFVIGTINTNIKNGQGMTILGCRKLEIVKHKDIFESLGSVVYKDPENILKYVTLVGSTNAIDISFVKYLIEKFPLANFNFKIREVKKCLDDSEKKTGSCCELVDEYLLSKTLAIKEVFSMSKKEAEDISHTTFVSTIDFFTHESILNIEMIDHHLKTVVTPNGCTAEGLKEINSERDFSKKEKIKLFYTKVSDRANLFEQDILTSIAESQKNK